MQEQASRNQLFDVLARVGIQVPEDYRRRITERIGQVINYHPVVGVFGKTGAGKSSLCNAVFGREICPISDVAACTREAQAVKLGMGEHDMTLVDVPGVGESRERDQEYAALYQEWLPKLDLVLWVIKADDRAFSSDEAFYRQLVHSYMEEGKPFLIVLNQVDKVEPFREWDEQARHPGARQAANIAHKRREVASFFDLPLSQVLTVSANERYGLVELVDKIIQDMPSEKRISVLREVCEENRSDSARDSSRDGFLDILTNLLIEVAPGALPRLITSTIAPALKSVWGSLKSLFGGLF